MLPAPPNITCDIHRGGSSPPAPAAVVGVVGHLRSVFRQGLEAGENLGSPGQRFTHILLVAVGADIRDTYDAGLLSTVDDPDSVWIPDSAGTGFNVAFVERRLRGTPFDHLRVYLNRRRIDWPSDEL